MICQDCGVQHARGFCWACNTMTGVIRGHVSYDCQRGELFEIDHARYPTMRVICGDCLPAFYRARWHDAVARCQPVQPFTRGGLIL